MRRISAAIPPDIRKKIIELDGGYISQIYKHSYYAYFEFQGKDLSISTVCVTRSTKKTKGKQHKTLYIKKVTVHIVGDKYCYIRDIDFHGMAGYIPEFYAEKRIDTPRKRYIVNTYADSGWYPMYSKNFRVYGWNADTPNRKLLNAEFLKGLSDWKYCGYDGTCDPLDYLNAYKANPKVELLAKTIGPGYATSKRITALAAKDRKFVAWIKENIEELERLGANIPDIMACYKSKGSIEETIKRQHLKRWFQQEVRDTYIQKKYRVGPLDSPRVPAVNLYENGDDEMKERVLSYILRNDTTGSHYNDYLIACTQLGLDMTDTKNLFPLDFRFWSELRLDQYAERRAEAASKEQAKRKKELEELGRRVEEIAKKYVGAELKKAEGYIAIIATSRGDLLREGEILHHCVGRMDYDKRIAEERSLIFFIRRAAEPDTPLSTVEISLSANTIGKVLQCYGAHDTTPPEEVRHFVYEVWQPRAQKKLKKIAERAAA